MPIKKILNDHRVVKIWTDDVDGTALEQLNNLSKLPFIAKNGIAVMPDVHAGMGSTIGSVIPTVKAIIPAAVGVDIGCGMMAARLNLTANDLPESLTKLRSQIESVVPTGFGSHKQDGDQHKAMEQAMAVRFQKRINEFSEDVVGGVFAKDFDRAWTKASTQLGTLGGGNHFIELCLDEKDDVWIMLHSGSRGIGNIIGTYFISKAKEEMERYFIDIPDKNLAYLPEGTPLFESYVNCVHWAQDYALENREVMFHEVLSSVEKILGFEVKITKKAINCHHNYVEMENHFGQNVWVTRKGAIRARKNDLGIIPGSMGARSYIVAGLQNNESYHSCSHGAGRVMSRTEARKKFNAKDLEKQTEGVECRKDKAVVDEIPSAYKDIDKVMENQSDLVKPIFTLKQVMCIKGA